MLSHPVKRPWRGSTESVSSKSRMVAVTRRHVPQPHLTAIRSGSHGGAVRRKDKRFDYSKSRAGKRVDLPLLSIHVPEDDDSLWNPRYRALFRLGENDDEVTSFECRSVTKALFLSRSHSLTVMSCDPVARVAPSGE